MIDSQLASITVSSTDLKRIQTPHSLLRDFGAHKTFTTRWQAAEFNFDFSSSPCRTSADHPAITPEGYSRA